MLRRSLYKKRGRNAFYHNWKNSIIICFLYAILIGSSIVTINQEFDYDYRNNIKVLNIRSLEGDTNSSIVNEFINSITPTKPYENKFLTKATRGIIGTLVNNISKTGSFLFGGLNALNEALFKDRIGASIIIIIGAILSLFYWIFVSKVLEVGLCRFFLENHRFTKTKVNKLILPYRLKKVSNIAYTMFIKNLQTILYGLTIIGGFIKYYEYRLVPFILAENPNIKTKDALNLSKSMVEGYKWELFKLDASFLGYQLLGFLTLNISNLVFTNPYINATYAEVYLYLQDLAKTRGCPKASLLNDALLDGDLVFNEYPIYDTLLKGTKASKLLSFNYNRNYSWLYLILIFFTVSIMGFFWETFLHLFRYGYFVKKGTLHGPWLPIYGGGSLAILVLLKKYRKNPFVYFILTMLVCGIIEYLTSLYLELVHHLSWWSYEGFFLNLNGRICLEGLIIFGIGGVLVTYILAPIISNIFDKINHELLVIISIVLVSLIIYDFYISSINPNKGEGITNTVYLTKSETN